jgi:hyaluronoglucosaminidase
VAPPFPRRGIIEGFYGEPWSHEARVEVIEFVAERGMNAYVYAPKDEPKHRARWREPYDGEEHARLADLAARCAKVGVRFGFAVSPGLDLDNTSATDRAALLAKLLHLLDAGTDWFVVALDDIPMSAGLGSEHGELAGWLRAELAGRAPEVELTLVPTDYVGAYATPYVRDLASSLPDGVDVMWTGATVCAPVVTAAEARARAAVMGGRPPLLWDNYPVNDGPMARALHLGPYRGREPALCDEVAGVLVNPMVQPRASKIALATVADFLCDPGEYDAEASWERAIADVGGGRAPSLRALARACADGPLLPASELQSAALVDVLADELDGPGWVQPVSRLLEELGALRDATSAWADDDPLGSELAPWLRQARLEVDAALAALRLVQQLRPVARRDGGRCHAAGPDAELTFLHVFALMLAWSSARAGHDRVILGPRFALHPAVVPLADGRPGVDVALAVHEDQSVVDRLCRLALDDYQRWRDEADADVRVVTRRGDVSCDEDGAYAVDDEVVLVRAGSRVTRLSASGGPPFSDPRLVS